MFFHEISGKKRSERRQDKERKRTRKMRLKCGKEEIAMKMRLLYQRENSTMGIQNQMNKPDEGDMDPDEINPTKEL